VKLEGHEVANLPRLWQWRLEHNVRERHGLLRLGESPARESQPIVTAVDKPQQAAEVRREIDDSLALEGECSNTIPTR
jgi:hypothetical protein